jgi:tight adherence protein B
MELIVSVMVMGALLMLGEALRSRGASTALLILAPTAGRERKEAVPPQSRSTWARLAANARVLAVVCAVGGGLAGSRVAGPAGLVAGALSGCFAPVLVERRRRRWKMEALERQLAEVVETVALAVRSGLSIAQSLEFAASEIGLPMRELLDGLIGRRGVGVTMEEALDWFGRSIGTDDAAMLVLILSIHYRSGGNVAGALEEVAATIHHRVTVRRELRALTAQGRVSGTILGALPIGFFLVLASTSQRELAPVYRSGAGIAMLATGLMMEGLAYLWIRRLLRVHV